MSTLRALQQQLLQAVMAPDTGSVRAAVRGDAIADASARLAIYQHGYRARLREALSIEFPGLQFLLGRKFPDALDSYIEAHPSAHYNIRWHGAGLAGFLAQAEPWRQKSQLTDMAALDWAISTAFDAADETSATPAGLAAIPAGDWENLRFTLLRNLQRVEVGSNVECIRRAADNDEPRPRLRRYARRREVLVWRQGGISVRYRSLEPDEARLLAAMDAGQPFAELCALLVDAHGQEAAMPRMAALLQRWLGDGLIGGWR